MFFLVLGAFLYIQNAPKKHDTGPCGIDSAIPNSLAAGLTLLRHG